MVPTRGGAPSGIWQVEARGAAEDTPTAPTKGHPAEEDKAEGSYLAALCSSPTHTDRLPANDLLCTNMATF